MIRALGIWLAASAAGVALIAWLPETWLGGGRLFSLSADHGPSASDAIGLAVILAGWAIWLQALWRRRHAMKPRPAALLGGGVVLAIGGCLAALTAGHDGVALVLGLGAIFGQLALGGMTRTEG